MGPFPVFHFPRDLSDCLAQLLKLLLRKKANTLREKLVASVGLMTLFSFL